MRILVVGAGAIGGYFGGRLLEAGRDVTFLVRPRRAAQLAERGLAITSPAGNYRHPRPPTIQADALREPFDLVLLSCKAYDLDEAIRSLAPAVGPRTTILPLLNGMQHIDVLERRFGPAAVLGGQCVIGATLNEKREIVHLNNAHTLGFGERDGSRSDRVKTIAAEMDGARFTAYPSGTVMADMWEKWVFLATLAGCTCLLRATMGVAFMPYRSWMRVRPRGCAPGE